MIYRKQASKRGALRRARAAARCERSHRSDLRWAWRMIAKWRSARSDDADRVDEEQCAAFGVDP